MSILHTRPIFSTETALLPAWGKTHNVLFHHLSQITGEMLSSSSTKVRFRAHKVSSAALQMPILSKQAPAGIAVAKSQETDSEGDEKKGHQSSSELAHVCRKEVNDSLSPIFTTYDKSDKFHLDVSKSSSTANLLLEYTFMEGVDSNFLSSQMQKEFSRRLNLLPKNEIYQLITTIARTQNMRLSSVEFVGKNSSHYSHHHAYVSSGSFEMDKKCLWTNGYALKGRHQPIGTMSVRTFKTRRDREAESERNPSLLMRIKNKLFPRGENGVTPLSQINSDKLKAMMADLPADEANKLKIAFAEGYIVATPAHQRQNSRTFRWLRTLQQVLVIAVFTALLASLMGSFGGGMFRVNVGNGNEVMPEDINVTFQDVKGVDEAKAELQEIVEFLRNPDKFVQLGGKLPKGVLLVGPPGTGKTLLARAVAGEAGVPFFHAAGPEFDEILVGQGARRVRDLFKAAKVKAPCVVFIDEIDSVGAKRTNSVLHPYANQTINQLLSEMDGFRQNEGVIVLGATNRREDLDKALLRPGRFDVEVQVHAPEYIGRKEILDYYLSRVKRGEDVDVDILARGTTGFTGADLENVVNQAALRAAIEGADRVQKKHLDFARDKVIMGPERKSRIPDEDTNKITAYHEGGHALVAHYTKNANTLHKVTIIPRGHSLGHTAYIPEKEQYHVTREQLKALMDTMMGGRAAEEITFGLDKITSGAGSDLKQATAIATNMVKEWGMSEKAGLRTVEEGNRSLVAINELAPSTNELIDGEIKRLLQESYDRAKSILKLHSKELTAIAEALIKYETLDAEDVHAILNGQSPTTPTKNKVARASTVTTSQTPRPVTPKQPPPTTNEVLL